MNFTTNNNETDLFKICPTQDNRLDLQLAPVEVLSRFLYSKAERQIILTIYPLSLCIGLIGNLAFLFVLFRIPYMKTITNMYLANLAVADLLFITSSCFDILAGLVLSPYVRSRPYNWTPGCAINVALVYVGHFASVNLIILMSLERYLGICKPLQHCSVVSKGRTIKLILFSWALGLGFVSLVVPNFALFKKICIIWPDDEQYAHLPNTANDCSSISPFFSWFFVIVQSIPYTICVISLTTVYTKIIIKLNSLSTNLAEQLSTEVVSFKNETTQIRNQVARLLIATGTVFFVSYFPYMFLRINGVILSLSYSKVGITLTAHQAWALRWFSRGLATVNSIVNPLIYNVTNARYRQAFKEAFRIEFSTRHDTMQMEQGVTEIVQQDVSDTF